MTYNFFFYRKILKDFIFLYFSREGKGGKKNGREAWIMPLARPQLARVLTGNQACNLPVCGTPQSPHPLNHTSRGCTISDVNFLLGECYFWN